MAEKREPKQALVVGLMVALMEDEQGLWWWGWGWGGRWQQCLLKSNDNVAFDSMDQSPS